MEPRSQPTPRAPSSKLLEGLKEELFELEVEHKQGRISQEEYEKTPKPRWTKPYSAR